MASWPPEIERASRLSDIVTDARSEDQQEQAAASEARLSPRRLLFVPVWISEITPVGPAQAHGYQLEDMSGSGLGIVAMRPFTPGETLLVSLTANNATWNGCMRVAHCTERTTDYKIGLEEAASSGGRFSTTGPDDTGEWAKSPDLAHLKDAIKKTMQAYRLARRSWGVLGTTVKERIRSLVDGLEPVPAGENGDGQRDQPRAGVSGDVHLVIPTHLGWRWLPAQITDISEGGAGLFVPFAALYDPAEHELAGDFRLEAGMPILIGLGTGPDILWLPAEVTHQAGSAADAMRVGVAFNTPGAQEAFGA